MSRISIFGSVMMASLVLASCQRQLEEELYDVVRFSVDAVEADDSVSLAETRTSFGGVSSGKRSMSWSSGDRVAIYSPHAMVMSGSTATHPAVSYNVSSSSSSSHVTPVNSSVHLLWGNESTQTFYGKYPDPAWTSSAPYSASSTFKSQTTASSSFSCYLPSLLTFTPTSGNYTYQQDMTYCYMTAYATASRNSSSFTLPFVPDVTTFQITIPNSYVAGVPVTSVTLSSDSHRLSGDYSVNIASTHSYSIPESSLTEADKSVTVYFTTPVSIPSGSNLVLRFFTCPVAASDLTLTITNFYGNVQTLPLKNSGGSWLSFPAGRYYQITCGAVPDVVNYYYNAASISDVAITGAHVLDDTWHTVTVNTEKDTESGYSGTNRQAKKTPWKAYYSSIQPAVGASVSGTSSYSATPPSWIRVVSGDSGEGYEDDFKFYVKGTVANGAQMNPGPSAQSMITQLQMHAMPVTHGSYCCLAAIDPVTGNKTDTWETANCYIVNGYGTFAIPLVYGNALKGTLNMEGASSQGYSWTSASSSNTYLRTFINASGQPIGYPYITYDPNLTIEDDDLNGCVVWQDTQKGFEIVKDEDIRIGSPTILPMQGMQYMIFTIEQENIKPGNVVLALRDGEDNILWSWHIWVRANISNTGCSSVKNNAAHELHTETVTYLPTRGNAGYTSTVKLLSEPLGWVPPISYVGGDATARSYYVSIVSTESNRVMSYFKVSSAQYHQDDVDYTSEGIYSAPYYQWGRKDPFLGTSGTAHNKVVTSAFYDIVLDDVNVPHGGFGTNEENLARRIQLPHYFNDNWGSNAYYYNLWNGESTSMLSDPYASGPTKVKKTIYDPCPRGFTVPIPNAFTGITSDGWGKYSASEIYATYEGLRSSNSYNNEYPKGVRMTTSHSSTASTYKLFLPALGWRSWRGGDVLYHYSGSAASQFGGDDYVYIWSSSAGEVGYDRGWISGDTPIRRGSSFDITSDRTIGAGLSFMTDGFMIIPQLEQ